MVCDLCGFVRGKDRHSYRVYSEKMRLMEQTILQQQQVNVCHGFMIDRWFRPICIADSGWIVTQTIYVVFRL